MQFMQHVHLHFRCFCIICYTARNEPLKIGSGQRDILPNAKRDDIFDAFRKTLDNLLPKLIFIIFF